MKKLLRVLKNEFVALVTRRSFLFTLFLLPLMSFAFVVAVNLLQPGQETSLLNELILPEAEPVEIHEGLVDPAGLVMALPAWIPADYFIRYPSQAAAEQALHSREIRAYSLVDPDYLQTGRVTIYSFASPMETNGNGQLRDALNYNLLGRDERLTRMAANPVEVDQVEYLSAPPAHDPQNAFTMIVPYVITVILTMVILSASSMLLSSIAWEKQNRVMEILITSVNPIPFLAGKTIALGTAGLLQSMIWLGTGYLMLRFTGSALQLPAGFDLPPSILAWGVVFFLLGYGLYAALMAGIGALVPGLREASQLTAILVMPMMLPLFTMGVIINDSNGTLAVVLSLIPLTAPMSVMMRMAVAPVPPVQIALSIGLLLLSTGLVVRAVAGLFRASNLLSGQPFTLRGFLRALRGLG